MPIAPSDCESPSSEWTTVRVATLVGGPVIGGALWLLFRPHAGIQGTFTEPGAIVLGLLAWMAIWWATQAVELAVTGLLPLIVLPLTGAVAPDKVLAPYANDIIFLFGGGSILGLAIERHGLGERLMQAVLGTFGRSPGRVVAAFLLVTATISAWVSNTATTLMMLPIAMACLALYSRGIDRAGPHGKPLANFEKAVLLAVGYGATIGGAITILGSPPNPVAAEWIRANGGDMSFLRWVSFGLPASVLMMIAAQIIFRKMLPVHGLPMPEAARQGSSPVALTRAGWVTIAVFVAAVALWIGAPFLKSAIPAVILRDGMVAIAAAFVLLVFPAARGRPEPIVPWSLTSRMPWGVLILVGGGLSLADAMQTAGVSQAIAGTMSGLGALPAVVVVLAIATLLVFASEIASNVALTATAVPIVGAMAPGLGIPADKLVIASALGASFAFMLPVGTPPNAIIYATGKVSVRDMIRVGFVLNLAAIVVITLVCSILL